MRRWVRKVMFGVRALLGRRSMDRDLTDEMAFHLEMEARKLQAQGLPVHEARAEALRRFGGVDRYRERTRETWGGMLVAQTATDVRYAARQLARRPSFAILALATLALGIGSVTALVGAVDSLLLRALPFEHGDRMVALWSPFDWTGAEYDLVRELDLEAVDGVAAYTLEGASLQSGGATSMLMTALVSPGAFEVLGRRPLMGRLFSPAEHREGAEAVVVVSHGLWQQELGGDPDVVGRRIDVDGTPTTVVGVMPRGFYFPVPEARLWRPLELAPGTPAYEGRGWLVMTARLIPGATAEAVDRDLARITTGLRERFEYPAAWDKTREASAEPLRHLLLGETRPALLLLLGAVGLLLLTASTNVAALLLARTSDRAGELALRSGLGADRGRITRQILAEGAVLGLAAGVLGAGVALGFHRVLATSLDVGGGMDGLLSLDPGVLAGAVVGSAVLGVAVAAVPLRDIFRGRLQPALGGARPVGGSAGNQRLQGLLVTAQVVLAVALVTSATLLIRSVDRLLSVDLGLDPGGVVVADVFAGHRPAAEYRQFLEDLTERVARLEGVRSAGTILRLPVRDMGVQGPVTIEDRPDLAGDDVLGAYYRPVMPGTLAALGTAVVRGRAFTPQDREGGVQVALVSRRLADEVWPGQDALGRRIAAPGFEGERWLTVVGVVEDVRFEGPTADPPRTVYRPVAQIWPWPNQTLVVRAPGRAPAALLAEIRSAALSLDPLVGVHRTATMDQVVRGSIGRPLRLRLFLGLFAGMALALGMVGVYGVVSYAVARRAREYGLRMALGADPGQVVRTVVRQGMFPVVVGVLGGMGLALFTGRLLAGFLFGVPAADPLSFGASAALLLVAGVGAALLPALRAGRVDPVEALRAD